MDKWIEKAKLLIKMEHEAEIVESESMLLEKDSMRKLEVDSISLGLFGRNMVEIVHPFGNILPAHKCSVGDIVQVFMEPLDVKESALRGVVAKVFDKKLVLAVDELNGVGKGQRVAVHRLCNEITFKKLQYALRDLQQELCSSGIARRMLACAFEGKRPEGQKDLFKDGFATFNDSLNLSQIDAVQFALASKDIALIHGPPGTGKTTTLVEIVQQAVQNFNLKVLVCAPSNVAVDNIAMKLTPKVPNRKGRKNKTQDKEMKITRVGHPAKLLPQVQYHCLDAKIQREHGTEIVADIRGEMEHILEDINSSKKGATKYSLRKEYKVLRKEIRTRETKIVNEIIKNSDVILTTNIGAATRILKQAEFDLVIIDEAAQAIEVSCWIPMLKGTRCVLAGDHKQLPPTIKSEKAKNMGLEKTLFDRMIELYANKAVKMLDTQYRMHHLISDWSSKHMYDSKLVSHESVANREIKHLSHAAEAQDMTNATLLLLDTSGCDMEEDAKDDISNPSKSNCGEANIVYAHFKALIEIGLDEKEIAIISPYNEQVKLMKEMLLPSYPNVEIRSVDGYQGREKEVVILSLVRSNPTRQVGFLSDDRRMNVAVTRAKRHCAIVCDVDTVSSHRFIKNLIGHFEEFGSHRSAEEYLDRMKELTPTINTLHVLEHKAGSKSSSKVKDRVNLSSNAITPPPAAPMTKSHKAKSVIAPKKSTELDTSDTPTNTEVQHVHSSAQDIAIPNRDTTSSCDDDCTTIVEKQNTFLALDESDSNGDGSGMENTTEQPDVQKVAKTSAKPKQIKKKSKKKKNNRKNSGKLDDKTQEMDDNALLDFAVTNSSLCGNRDPPCTTKISLMGQLCKHCNTKFCFTHSLPEIHGCGKDARTFAKQKFKHEFRHAGSRTTSSIYHDNKASTTDHRSAKNKLKKQLATKKADRASKSQPK